jgi:hypothetical protein
MNIMSPKRHGRDPDYICALLGRHHHAIAPSCVANGPFLTLIPPVAIIKVWLKPKSLFNAGTTLKGL